MNEITKNGNIRNSYNIMQKEIHIASSDKIDKF